MHRAAFASFRGLRQTGTGLVLLTAATIGSVNAHQASSACRLLQVAELEAAIGGKAKEKPSGSVASVPGMTLDQCAVVLSGSGQTHPVSIRIVTNLSAAGDEAIKARNVGEAREEQWKKPGAKLEQGTVGKALCILAGRPNVASHTTCSIPRGKGYVEIDVIGSVGSLPSIATVGALAEKAMTRL